jgi:hypothetical protein
MEVSFVFVDIGESFYDPLSGQDYVKVGSNKARYVKTKDVVSFSSDAFVQVENFDSEEDYE